MKIDLLLWLLFLPLSLAIISCSQTDSLNFETLVKLEEQNQPCQDGTAASYPCLNVDLRARLTPDHMNGERLNDIWGWTDPQTGKEYALVGLSDGVSLVDISKPSEPIVIGKLTESIQGTSKKGSTDPGDYLYHDEDEEKSTWRDLKVYRNHLFVISDGQEHGLQVFDLTRLRNPAEIPATFTHDTHYSHFGNAHNLAINEETGFAYIVGSNVDGGGLYIMDISNPEQPAFVTTYADTLVGFNSTGYVHDTQCAVYRGPDSDYGGHELCFNSSETHFSIVDVTDKDSIYTVSRGDYEGRGYAHQGWLTEDHRYFLLDDEFDENRNESNTRTYIWDIEDLDHPVVAGFYEASNPSIDHNQYVKGDNVYQANYTAGLRILNLDKIESADLEEVAYFDTFPKDNEVKFEGAWSNYPFFDSGIVIVSDVTNGLFILEPTY